MLEWLRERLLARPWWLNVLLLFCVYMSVVYVPWDLFLKPVTHDEEVWFGIRLTGWAAKLATPLHWAVYGAGAYGLWRMRPWFWPWGSLYVAQIAVGTWIWSVRYIENEWGWLLGVTGCLLLGALAYALWRARPRFRRTKGQLRERYGEWALITGASAGIGAELARALAREGISCVLTARREERLRVLAHEIETKWGVRTRTVAVDLATIEGPDLLAKAVVDLPVSIVVNNAGSGYAGRFEKLDAKRLREMVLLNCVTPVVLTRRLLPALRERGRGAVLFTGSVAGRQPLPLHAVYSATKGFNLLLGEALWAELRGSGIAVLVIEPGSTATEFQEVAGELPHPGVSPARVVADALAALGQQPSVISGWFNWLRAQTVRVVPRSLAVLVAERVIRAQTPLAMR